MLNLIAMYFSLQGVEALLRFHNDFMTKYRQAQKEGRL